jgi:DNA processing protein
MNGPISDNTKAILLLAAPLLVAGKHRNGARILTITEYNQLARLLRERNTQPADLLSSSAPALLADLRLRFATKRLDELLARGFLLSQAVETWSSRAIRVASWADPDYPRRFKAKLGLEAPPLLYGCGDWSLLEGGGLAVVGSRHADKNLIEFAQKVGSTSAAAGVTVVSGAAKGIDRAAMQGSLSTGGRAIGIVADRLRDAVVAGDSREAIREKRLVLVSPFDPAAGFNVGNAMQRNKLIYGLADAALVVNSDHEKGGTWSGAIEQIERFHACPVFVRTGEGIPIGNRKLIEAGACPWPNPTTAGDLTTSFDGVGDVRFRAGRTLARFARRRRKNDDPQRSVGRAFARCQHA